MTIEHVLRAADVVASVRKMLAGRMTKAQLGAWALRAMLAAAAETTPI